MTKGTQAIVGTKTSRRITRYRAGLSIPHFLKAYGALLHYTSPRRLQHKSLLLDYLSAPHKLELSEGIESILKGWSDNEAVLRSEPAKELITFLAVPHKGQRKLRAQKKALRRLEYNSLKFLRKFHAHNPSVEASIKAATQAARELLRQGLFTSHSSLVLLEDYRHNLSEISLTSKSLMDPITFFTAMQALGAFLQIWQTERNREKATKAYDRAKDQAPSDPQVQARARSLGLLLQNEPVLKTLFSNRVARCKDRFEAAFRDAPEQELDGISLTYKKCTCTVLNAIRTAQNGKLDDALSELWTDLDCPIVLAS